MVDGGQLGFDHSKIIARFTDKQLVDISCPGSSWPSLSEKPTQHIFVNGTSGLILHYPAPWPSIAVWQPSRIQTDGERQWAKTFLCFIGGPR